MTLITLCSSSLFAQKAIVLENVEPYCETKPLKFDGYAYMNFGVEKVNYAERPTLLNFELDAKTSNIVQMSGGLTRVNDNFDFSVDSIATLLPNEGSEAWSASTNLNNAEGTAPLKKGAVAQRNSYTLVGSQLQLLVHYKYTSKVRILGGLTSANQTFKRYDQKQTSALIEKKKELLEESCASFMANIGFGYESYIPAHDGDRFRVRAIFGLPLWHRTLNTAEIYGDLEFNDKAGYNAELDLYWGYPVHKGVEVGLFFNASRQYRVANSTAKYTLNGTTYEAQWPENTLDIVRSGVSFVWKFRE